MNGLIMLIHSGFFELIIERYIEGKTTEEGHI